MPPFQATSIWPLSHLFLNWPKHQALPVAETFVEEHHRGALHLVGKICSADVPESKLRFSSLTLTKARREAAMTQMDEARKRAVAVRGEARTAFVKILTMQKDRSQ